MLWVGTYEHGLDRIDRRTGEVTHYAPDPSSQGACTIGVGRTNVFTRRIGPPP